MLSVGMKVRVQLNHPVSVSGKHATLHGNFRNTDIRWTPDIHTISNVIIDNNEPILYQVDNNATSYTFNQLQVVPQNEQEPPLSMLHGDVKQYAVKKIHDKKINKKLIYYLIQWRSKPDKKDWVWESKATLLKNKDTDVKTQQLMDAFDEMHPTDKVIEEKEEDQPPVLKPKTTEKKPADNIPETRFSKKSDALLLLYPSVKPVMVSGKLRARVNFGSSLNNEPVCESKNGDQYTDKAYQAFSVLSVKNSKILTNNYMKWLTETDTSSKRKK